MEEFASNKFEDILKESDSFDDLIIKIIELTGVRKFLDLNRHEEIDWVNKEQWERLIEIVNILTSTYSPSLVEGIKLNKYFKLAKSAKYKLDLIIEKLKQDE